MFFCISGGNENPKRSEVTCIKNPKSQDDCRKDQLKIKYLANHTSPEKQKNTVFTAFPGSCSVEAALVLPLFIIVIVALYTLFSFMIMEAKLNTTLNRVGKKLAIYQYALEKLQEEEDSGIKKQKKSTLFQELGEDVSGFAVSETLVKRMVLADEEVKTAAERYVKNGSSGLHFPGSQFDKNDQLVILKVTYELEVPFFSSYGVKFTISQRSIHRAWTGKSSDSEEEEQIVFITEYGNVYHTSVSCNYLKLSIHETTLDRINDLRNKDGCIYKECEACRNHKGGKTVYYTDYGEVFHYSRNCSGLKRTIQSVGISQVGNRRKCKKCERRENE